MLSAMIGGFPIIAGILIILFGLFMFKVGSWIKTTTKYDVPITFSLSDCHCTVYCDNDFDDSGIRTMGINVSSAFIIHLLFSVFNEYLNQLTVKNII